MTKNIKKIWNKGDLFIWLTGAALALSLILTAGLILIILANGMGYFWPAKMVRFTLKDGQVFQGQVTHQEAIPQPGAPPGTAEKLRIQIKQGNRDMFGTDFLWMDEASIASREFPSDLVVVERREWGDFYGKLMEVRKDNRVLAMGMKDGLKILSEELPSIDDTLDTMNRLAKVDIGKTNHYLEKARLRLKKLSSEGIKSGTKIESLKKEIAGLLAKYQEQENKLFDLRGQMKGSIIISVPDGRTKEIPLSKIVRIYAPNTLGIFGKMKFFFAKTWEFIYDDPRESNTEGGVFPAIFGTVMMVMLMSLFATPLGVLAAFYLREYAKKGPFVSMVRIAVNNLAGVPSIVFGVFGVGFFIYFIGGSIDNFFFEEALPSPTFGTGGILWASLTLALLTIPVVIVATEEGLAAVPGGLREASLALGATKFETTWRVLMPAVMPSILTGLILAMSRAAGEVAPLMITGVVKLAPSLPLDSIFPFVHMERKFMHLGFHIYDVGFQSPNVDAARPMVYTTTLLLILIVLVMNFLAIYLRNRLKRKLQVSAV